jgi:hypothetical protein
LKPIIAAIETSDLSDVGIDRIINGLGRPVPFDAIKFQFGLSKQMLRLLMKRIKV